MSDKRSIGQAALRRLQHHYGPLFPEERFPLQWKTPDWVEQPGVHMAIVGTPDQTLRLLESITGVAIDGNSLPNRVDVLNREHSPLWAQGQDAIRSRLQQVVPTVLKDVKAVMTAAASQAPLSDGGRLKWRIQADITYERFEVAVFTLLSQCGLDCHRHSIGSVLQTADREVSEILDEHFYQISHFHRPPFFRWGRREPMSQLVRDATKRCADAMEATLEHSFAILSQPLDHFVYHGTAGAPVLRAFIGQFTPPNAAGNIEVFAAGPPTAAERKLTLVARPDPGLRADCIFSWADHSAPEDVVQKLQERYEQLEAEFDDVLRRREANAVREWLADVDQRLEAALVERRAEIQKETQETITSLKAREEQLTAQRPSIADFRDEMDVFVSDLSREIEVLRSRAATSLRRPGVYFERHQVLDVQDRWLRVLQSIVLERSTQLRATAVDHLSRLTTTLTDRLMQQWTMPAAGFRPQVSLELPSLDHFMMEEDQKRLSEAVRWKLVKGGFWIFSSSVERMRDELVDRVDRALQKAEEVLETRVGELISQVEHSLEASLAQFHAAAVERLHHDVEIRTILLRAEARKLTRRIDGALDRVSADVTDMRQDLVRRLSQTESAVETGSPGRSVS